jgi:hypothetical protein
MEESEDFSPVQIWMGGALGNWRAMAKEDLLPSIWKVATSAPEELVALILEPPSKAQKVVIGGPLDLAEEPPLEGTIGMASMM